MNRPPSHVRDTPSADAHLATLRQEWKTATPERRAEIEADAAPVVILRDLLGDPR